MPQNTQQFSGARPASPAQRVVEDVIAQLEGGRIVPGQRLIEADLCLRYGVGRGPVREALQRLAIEGVVEIGRNRGARIREVNLADAIHTLEVTELLLGLAARSAAIGLARSGGAPKLRQLIGELREASLSDEEDAFVRARQGFYNSLLRIGDNKELLRIMPSVQVHVVRAQYNLNRAQRKLVNDFIEIGNAVLVGDPVAAETAARRHVRTIREQLAGQLEAKNKGG